MSDDDLGIDEHTLQMMAVTMGITKLKRCRAELSKALLDARGHPGPVVWEKVAQMIVLIDDLYAVTFHYEQTEADLDADR